MKMQHCKLIALLIVVGFSWGNAVHAEAEQEQTYIAVLQSEAKLFDKMTACKKLAVVGTSESVETLGALLCDESLGDFARYALERIEGPGVDQAFRDAMDTCQGRLLAGVVNSIGVRRDAKATNQLSKLAMDPASGVSAEAMAALGRIGGSEAIKTIYKGLKSDPQTLRLTAADAALVAAERFRLEGNQEDALKLYAAVGKADVPTYFHAAAVYGEILGRGADGLPLLIEQLKSDDPAMVAVALRAGRTLPGAEVAERLADELPKFSSEIQVLLIKVLVDRGDAASLESIQALAVSDNPNVRAESLKVLGQIGDASSAAILLKAASAEGADAAIARDSLRALNSEGVDEVIVEYMKKATPEVKAVLIDILSDRNAVIAVNAVIAETQSEDVKVQRAALKAFGKLAGPEHIDRAVGLIEGLEGDAVRKDAERAVVSVAIKIPDKSKQADAIIAALKREKDIQARCSFVRILGRVGGAGAFEIVKELMADDNKQVRDAAVRVVTSWEGAEALETLYEIFQNTDDPTHRVLALRGYVRLLRQDVTTPPEKTAEILGEIMGQVETAGEKKNVLGGLALVKHPFALTVVSKYINDPQVKDEAALAAIQIGRAIAGARPDQARAAALEIVKTTSNDSVRKQAQDLLKTIEGFEDFITGWQVSGPYLKDGHNYSRLLDVRFGPETGADGATWSVMPAGTNPAKLWLLDLLKLYPGNSRAAYVYTWVHSTAQQKGRMELGTDDGVKVWLNGEIVHVHDVGRAAVPGSDKVDIQLRAGWNKVMLKITQDTGPWGFCMKLVALDGGQLEGISVDCFYQPPLTKLFDGETFTGWEGDLNWFSIDDGAIVAGKPDQSIPNNFFLATTKEYYNFELQLKVKTSNPDVNGGIQFRSKRIENHHEVSGYQADVGMNYWGGLYDESRDMFVAPLMDIKNTIKNGDWNDYRIRCVGDRIQLFVNGIITVDYVETDPAIVGQGGIIAVQIHAGPASQVWYRDVLIKEL